MIDSSQQQMCFAYIRAISAHPSEYYLPVYIIYIISLSSTRPHVSRTIPIRRVSMHALAFRFLTKVFDNVLMINRAWLLRRTYVVFRRRNKSVAAAMIINNYHNVIVTPADFAVRSLYYMGIN